MSKRINESLPRNRRLGQIGINNQGEKITIIAYRKSEDIDVQFEDGTIVENRTYGNFLKGRMKHPIRYEESFAYHIEVELSLDINKIWNFEKNTVSPYEIYKNCHEKVWLYCLEKDHHNNEGGYERKCYEFYNGSRCGYCGNNHKTHKLDSLAYLYPQIAEMIVTDERNNLTMEDLYEIAPYNDKKFYFKCSECKKGSSQKKRVKDIIRRNFSCEYCSDGISIPNKILRQISEQLGLNLQYEYIPEWLNNKRLDGYDDNFKIAIEMDGNYGNHEDKTIDNWKDIQCLKHGVYVIRIDLTNDEYDKNKFEYIKKQILNSSLALIYDLSKVNWELAWECSLKSLVWEVKRLAEEDYTDIEMAKILNISENTIRNYKKQLGIKTRNEIKQENLLKTKELLQQGKTNVEIAKILEVKKDTVNKYIRELKNIKYLVGKSH